MAADTLLCGRRCEPGAVTVADYLKWEQNSDGGWSQKPSFIKQRLRERYIDPVDRMDERSKNGFMIMAVSCLLIETLESFYRGWHSTKNKSQEAFRLFFRHQTRFSAVDQAHMTDEFYENIRCAILHQGETAGGWTIWRSGPILALDEKRINATSFHRALANALDGYCRELEGAAPESKIRRRFDGKMKAVIANCG